MTLLTDAAVAGGAKEERERINKGAAEGLKTAKVRGVKLGRLLALDEFRIKRARERHDFTGVMTSPITASRVRGTS